MPSLTALEPEALEVWFTALEQGQDPHVAYLRWVQKTKGRRAASLLTREAEDEQHFLRLLRHDTTGVAERLALMTDPQRREQLLAWQFLDETLYQRWLAWLAVTHQTERQAFHLLDHFSREP